MNEIQKLIKLCRQMMFQLRYFREENKRLEGLIFSLKESNTSLKEQIMLLQNR